MVEGIRHAEAFEVLRKEPFGENPDGLVSVYHITRRSLLGDIAIRGLQPDRFGTGFILGVESDFSKEKVATPDLGHLIGYRHKFD